MIDRSPEWWRDKDSQRAKNVCLLPWPLHPATNTLKS
jgi:hypothetical protein